MTDLEQLKKDALGFPERAKRMIVHNATTLTIANEFIREVKGLIKAVSDSYDPIIRHAQAEKKKYINPLRESEQTAKIHVGAYLTLQAEIRRKAEEKVRKEEEDRQKKEDKILAEAKILKDSGKENEAASLVEEVPLPAQIEIPPEPEAEGLSMRQVVDTERINMIVKQLGRQTRIPGIRVYPVWKWDITNRELIPKEYYKTSVASRKEG